MLSTAVQYAKAMGLRVIGLDISNSQLDAVKKLGADVVINTMEDPDDEAKIKTITQGGCHAAAVFSASNVAYESALKTLRYVDSGWLRRSFPSISML
jgi:D-arabinose 1-dehydrogenase-like Zn-dependent alcohol dehydrogenase